MNRGTSKPEDLLQENWKKINPESISEYREEERRDTAEKVPCGDSNARRGCKPPADGIAARRRTRGHSTLTKENTRKKRKRAVWDENHLLNRTAAIVQEAVSPHCRISAANYIDKR
jgi:hypothetical protein